MANPAPDGWVFQPDEIDKTCQAFEARGIVVNASDNPQLAGFGKGKSRFLFQSEKSLFGQFLSAEFQQRGTCVSRGTKRAIEDAYYFDLVNQGLTGQPLRICYELIYAGARINIGGGSLGYGDGAVGAWAAQFVHDFGILQRGDYDGFSLTDSNENLAVSLGNPGKGVPQSLLSRMTSKVLACHKCNTVEDIRDCIVSGYGVAFCSNTIWGPRDQNGMSRPASRGGHCEVVRGTFVNPQGDLCFARNQSWGDQPSGPNRVQTADGQTVELPQGGYGVYASDMASALSEGEAWAFGRIVPFTNGLTGKDRF